MQTYVTGLVNQELLLQNEYLAAENRILKARLVAVGMTVARHPPHRTVLALLTHTVPTLDNGVDR